MFCLRRLYKTTVIRAEVIALTWEHVCNCALCGNYKILVAGRSVGSYHEITVALLRQVGIIDVFPEEFAEPSLIL